MFITPRSGINLLAGVFFMALLWYNRQAFACCAPGTSCAHRTKEHLTNRGRSHGDVASCVY